MHTSNMVLFTGNGDNSKVTLSSKGAEKTTYLSKKEYGEKHGVKGQALNRAHLQYRIDRGIAGNGNLAAMMTSGQIVLEMVKKSASGRGFTAGFSYASTLGVVATDPKQEAAKLSDEELMAILAARKATPAAQAVA